MSKGVELIAAERERQVSVEGWTREHDDRHSDGELAQAAACYAVGEPCFVETRGFIYNDSRLPQTSYINLWPWEPQWYKPKDRLSDLVRAGALIAAEIDRLLRDREVPTVANEQARLREGGAHKGMSEELSHREKVPLIKQYFKRHGIDVTGDHLERDFFDVGLFGPINGFYALLSPTYTVEQVEAHAKTLASEWLAAGWISREIAHHLPGALRATILTSQQGGGQA